mmetsp:Transcript_84810/g.236658  ORF Transcript_84810/g.236658 Transcript_84810/m.236658 type:complete len:286 (+) Transcript_84810:1259-2116(+)
MANACRSLRRLIPTTTKPSTTPTSLQRCSPAASNSMATSSVLHSSGSTPTIRVTSRWKTSVRCWGAPSKARRWRNSSPTPTSRWMVVSATTSSSRTCGGRPWNRTRMQPNKSSMRNCGGGAPNSSAWRRISTQGFARGPARRSVTMDQGHTNRTPWRPTMEPTRLALNAAFSREPRVLRAGARTATGNKRRHRSAMQRWPAGSLTHAVGNAWRQFVTFFGRRDGFPVNSIGLHGVPSGRLDAVEFTYTRFSLPSPIFVQGRLADPCPHILPSMSGCVCSARACTG